jgi:hypothetical protein
MGIAAVGHASGSFHGFFDYNFSFQKHGEIPKQMDKFRYI